MVTTDRGTTLPWGDNDYGKLGDGSTLARLAPVACHWLAGAKVLALGFMHTLFVGADGRTMALGDNDFGRLGDGTDTDRLQPVAVLAP